MNEVEVEILHVVYDNLLRVCNEADLNRHIEEYRTVDSAFARALVAHHEVVEKQNVLLNAYVVSDLDRHIEEYRGRYHAFERAIAQHHEVNQ